MADSKELQEFRRLLRSGFRVQRIDTRSPRTTTDVPDSRFEIVTTESGSKAQFTINTEAALQSGQAGPVEIEFSGIELAVEVHLYKQSNTRIISSREKDFVDFAAAMHPSLDVNGDVALRRFADNNRYWDESKTLATVSKNRKTVVERLLASGGKVDNSLKVLLLELLRTRDCGAARFLPLKHEFVALEAALASEGRRLLQIQQKLYVTNPKAKKYGDLVEELLNALWQLDDTFIKRSIRFLGLAYFDTGDAIFRAFEQRKHVDDLLGMVAKRSPMPGRQGLPHLLDAYRRYCESLRPFVDVLSEAVRIVEKLPPISPNTGYKKRVDLIKATRLVPS